MTTRSPLRRLVFFQYGNYARAWRRMQAGGAETYREQFASVRFVAGLAGARSVTTVTFSTEAHDDELAPGLRSIGLAAAVPDRRAIGALYDSLAPDAVICRTPLRPLMAETAARGVPCLPSFADILATSGLRERYRNARLRLAMRGMRMPCISNHGLNASRSVVDALGVEAARVVPWDWQPLVAEPMAKGAVAEPAAPRLFFAGALSAAKGVGDCLEAVATLRRSGIAARLSLAGNGDRVTFEAQAEALGIAEAVTFLGLVPNTEVRAQMAAHDVVVVPSRHEYPEGLPNTIYEGLASRSALVISDHPAFARRLEDGRDCLVFTAAKPASLAAAITRLAREPALYAALSARAPEALANLTFGLPWAELVTLFLDDPDDSTGWVGRHSLAALIG